MIKKRKLIASLLSLLMLVSLFVPQQSALAAESGIEVQFNNGDTQADSNTIYAKFKVVNKGSSSVSLSQLKLRYYYTKDADKSQNFYCDHAGMMNGYNYLNMTDKITGTIVNMSKSVATADTYVEIGFTSDAGSIAAGGTIEIQTRISRSDWTNYNQSNDFSYKKAGTYVQWDQIAAYLGGTLVFGKSPTDESNTKDPEISPKSATFNKSVPKNVTITLTPNGNTFKGISGLTRNTDYTVSGNTVTLLTSYLSTLSLGSKSLTFDFGVANNPKLNLSITEDVKDNLEVIAGTVTGAKNEIVTVPINFKNVSKVGDIITCNFYLTYDTSLLEAVSVTAGDIVMNPGINFASKINENISSISFLFLDETLGDQLITKDGVFANIDFKVIGNAGQTAKLQFTDEGAFGDSDMQRINGVNKIDGAVVITASEDPQPSISPTTGVFDKYTPSNIKVTLTPNGSTFVGTTGLRNGTDYTVSGNTITILESYLSTLSLGSKSLTFDFGVANNPKLTLTIKDSTPSGEGLKVTAGTVTGATNEIVTVPINFKNVSKVGDIITCNFYLTYDTSLLEAVSVTAGDIVMNPGINFSSKINKNISSISFLFLDETLGDQLITEDGVFANIDFKVIGNAGQTAKLQFTDEGAFGDSDMQRINGVDKIDGAVVITASEDPQPSISPTTGVFDKYTPSNIKVTLTPNGSTFVGITGLRNGTDYTVSGNTITILESYLSTLSLGSKSLTFDFGVDNNPKLALTIKDSAPVETEFNISIGKVSGNTGDTITVPVILNNISKVNSVITCNYYITFDESILQAISVESGDIIVNAPINFDYKINKGSISFLFLDNTLGDELITEDGVMATITFKILGTSGETSLNFTDEGAFGDGDMQRISNMKKINGSVTIH